MYQRRGCILLDLLLNIVLSIVVLGGIVVGIVFVFVVALGGGTVTKARTVGKPKLS